MNGHLVGLWYENINSVEWKTPRPVQVGSQSDRAKRLAKSTVEARG